MNLRIKDRTNQKFNNWTFIKYEKTNKYGESLWLCRCDCGFEKIQVAGNVTSGGSTKCKSCSQIHNYNNLLPTPVWKTIVRNASNRNKQFLITKEFAENLFISQDKKCTLSGLDIVFAKSFKEYSNGFQTASLDRIDSSIGYIESNVQWIHKTINIMKNNLKESDFINFCKIIVDHHN